MTVDANQWAVATPSTDDVAQRLAAPSRGTAPVDAEVVLNGIEVAIARSSRPGDEPTAQDLKRPGQLRRIARAQLNRWNLDGLADSAVLLITELVTNALLHGQGPEFAFRVIHSAGEVRIEVYDGSPVRPYVRAAGPDDESGRGMTIVAATAHSWGGQRGRKAYLVHPHRAHGSEVPVTAQPEQQCEISRHDVERVLTGLRISLWLDGVDVDSFYDHLEAVLGQDAAPAMGQIKELTQRLQGALIQLVAIVLAHRHHQPGAKASRDRAGTGSPGGGLAWRLPTGPRTSPEARAGHPGPPGTAGGGLTTMTERHPPEYRQCRPCRRLAQRHSRRPATDRTPGRCCRAIQLGK